MITPYATARNVRGPLLAAAVARGHQVTVAAPTPPREIAGPLAELGATYRHWPVERTTIAPRADLRSLVALAGIVRELRPDVVLAYQLKAVLLGVPLARWLRVPRVVVLVNGLGTLFDPALAGGRAARLGRQAYGLALRHAHEIVFQNTDDPALLTGLGLLAPTQRWRHVPGSGVDLAAFAPHGPRAQATTFTFIGRLLGAKGVREFVEAARLLRREQPHARCRLVGPLEAPSHPDAITRAELDAWRAAGDVTYAGVVEDIRTVLADTLAFVLPSHREGLPRTSLEAMAAALPVITTDTVGCRDTVVDGETGFLVPLRAPTALADRMARYLRDPAMAARHGRAGRARAEARFGLTAVNQQMLDALALG
ncbi:MAG: glycosyltransferase family 4 protein [Kofleriaceae bacterium]